MKTLKDKAEAGETEAGKLTIGQGIEAGSQELDTARRWHVYPADQLEQGGLSTS